MTNGIKSDLVRIRMKGDTRKLPPQSSAEDTSNWENRPIALPDPSRPLADFLLPESNVGKMLYLPENPYLIQEQLKSKNKNT